MDHSESIITDEELHSQTTADEETETACESGPSQEINEMLPQNSLQDSNPTESSSDETKPVTAMMYDNQSKSRSLVAMWSRIYEIIIDNKNTQKRIDGMEQNIEKHNYEDTLSRIKLLETRVSKLEEEHSLLTADRCAQVQPVTNRKHLKREAKETSETKKRTRRSNIGPS